MLFECFQSLEISLTQCRIKNYINEKILQLTLKCKILLVTFPFHSVADNHVAVTLCDMFDCSREPSISTEWFNCTVGCHSGGDGWSQWMQHSADQIAVLQDQRDVV